ncbi:hypothetical protein KBA41_03225 [Candidatus Ozemobacteraceae bacterium]|nr:hypothetical protein [Candidatus Ozemobacteraceae bacterium]
MKKGLFVVYFVLSLFFGMVPAISVSAQQAPSSPEAPFTAWLMNNEARTMAILAGDRLVAERLSHPLGFLGAPSMSPFRSELDLWNIHLQYYRFLPEAVEIARLARRFGSGEFAKVFERAFPGNWVIMPMIGIPTFNARELSHPLNTSFRENTLACMGIDKDRDADLTERLKRSQGSISPDDRRLLGQYFETFLALYPNNRSVRVIDGFLKHGMKKSTAQSVASALGLNTASATESLLEFEETTADVPATVPASDTAEGTMPDDAFDILK